MSATATPVKPVFVSVADAAAYLAVSPRSVRRKIADGTLPAFKVAGDSLRIRLSDLDNVVKPVGGGA